LILKQNRICLNAMKKLYQLLLSFCLICYLGSCSKTDLSPYSTEESTIYSENNKTLFKEILLDIVPYILDAGSKKHLVVSNIQNVTITVNDSIWGVFNSLNIDTSLVTKFEFNNYFVTNDTLKYSTVVPYTSKKQTLTKAYQYSLLLNRYITLEPGFYMAKIESFEVKNNLGILKKVSTNISVPFEVKENFRSSYLGKLEVEIK